MSLEKNFTKRVLAALAAVTMMFSAAGCGESTSWAAKYGEQTANAGVFTYYQMEALSEAKSLIQEEDENADISDLKKLKSMKVEGVDIETWVNNKAKEKIKRFLAINSKFNELGFELSDDDKANVDYYVEYGWMYGQNEKCEKIGTSQESYRQVVELSYKEKQLFSYYYGEGGEREYPQEDYNKYLEENLSRVKMIKLNLKDGKDAELDEAGKKEVKAMAEDYLKRANSGEDIDVLIKEYNDYYEKLKEEAEKAEGTEEEASEDAPVTTAAEDAEAPEVTTVSGETEESAETTAADDSEAPEVTTVSDEAVTTAADDSEEPEVTTVSAESEEAETTEADGESEEPAVTTEVSDEEKPEEDKESEETDSEEDADPYKNENLFFKGSEEDGYNPSQVVNEAIFSKCKTGGEAVLVEDEENLMIYVIVRLDVLERTDFTEGDYKDYLLWKILEDEFTVFEFEWMDESLLKNNNRAFSRYKAFKSEE